MDAVIAVRRLDRSLPACNLRAFRDDGVRRCIADGDAEVAADRDIRTRLPCGCAHQCHELLFAACRNRYFIRCCDLRAASQNDRRMVIDIGKIDARRARNFRLLCIGFFLRRSLARELRRCLEGQVVRRVGKRQCAFRKVGRNCDVLFEHVCHGFYGGSEFFCLLQPLLRDDIGGVIVALFQIRLGLILRRSQRSGVRALKGGAVLLELFEARAEFADHIVNICVENMPICRDVNALSRDVRCVGCAGLLCRKGRDTRRILDVRHVHGKAAHALRFLGLMRLNPFRLSVLREVPVRIRMAVDGTLRPDMRTAYDAVRINLHRSIRANDRVRRKEDIRLLLLIQHVDRAAERDFLPQLVEFDRRGKSITGKSDLGANASDDILDLLCQSRDGVRIRCGIGKICNHTALAGCRARLRAVFQLRIIGMDVRPRLARDGAAHLRMRRTCLLRHVDSDIEQGVFLAGSARRGLQFARRIGCDVRLFLCRDCCALPDFHLCVVIAARYKNGDIHDLRRVRSCAELRCLCMGGCNQILAGFCMNVHTALLCREMPLYGHICRALSLGIGDRHRRNCVGVLDVCKFDFGCGRTRIHGGACICADDQRTLLNHRLAVLRHRDIRALCRECGICADLHRRLTAHNHVGRIDVDGDDPRDFIGKTRCIGKRTRLRGDILRLCRGRKTPIRRHRAVHRRMRRRLDNLPQELRRGIRGCAAECLALICRVFGIRREHDISVSRNRRTRSDGQLRLDFVFAAAEGIRVFRNIVCCAVKSVRCRRKHDVAAHARRSGQRAKPRACAARIDQRGKIEILLTRELRRTFRRADRDRGRTQMNAALRVELTVNDDGAVRIQRDRPRLECVHIRRRDLDAIVLQMVLEPVCTWCECRNAARIDNARPADRHPLGGQKEHIAADGRRIFQHIDRPADVDAPLHHVDERVRAHPALIHLQIGDVILIDDELGKCVGRNIVFDLVRHNGPHVVRCCNRPRIRRIHLLDVRRSVCVRSCVPARHAPHHRGDCQPQTQRLFSCQFPITAHNASSFHP